MSLAQLWSILICKIAVDEQAFANIFFIFITFMNLKYYVIKPIYPDTQADRAKSTQLVSLIIYICIL